MYVRSNPLRAIVVGVVLCGAAAPLSVHAAGAIHDIGEFTANTLAANDDGSTGLESIGFSINYFGTTYTQLYVNNNGNVTFDNPLSTFTPFNLLSTSTPIIAPFFGDVDTRNGGSALVTYGQGTVGGRSAFGVNWVDSDGDGGVGYYDTRADKLNEFQLIIIDRSDTGAGNFDFEFNYDQIQWETGEASDGVDGLGGDSARAGWSNGVDTSFEISGAAVNGAYLDTNLISGLIYNSLNSDIDGQYIFQVRNGRVLPPVQTPEPVSTAVLGVGLAGLALFRRRKT